MSSRARGIRLTGKRASAIALLATTITAAASLVTVTPASAAVLPDTSVTIAPGDTNSNQQAGATATATLDVTYTQGPGLGTTPQIDYAFVSGPGGITPAPALPQGAPCQGTGGGTSTCVIPDPGGAPGTFGVQVFADNDGTGSYATNGDDVITAPATVIFSGQPSQVSLTPTTSTTTNGTCVLYKATVVDAMGQPAVSWPFKVTVVENSTTTPDTFAFFAPDCTTPAGLSVTEGTTPTSVTDSVDIPTGPDGTFTIGIASSAAVPARVGTGSVTVTSDQVPTATASSSATWTGGGTGAVASLSVNPPSLEQYINTTATFAVTATDQAGSPVSGVAISEETSAASADPSLGPAVCGTTNSSGVASCTIANDGTEGTDYVTFWVDNGLTSPPLQHTTGPDPDEPQVRATVKFDFDAQFNNNALTCADQLVADKGSQVAHCDVPTAQPSVTFTETLTETDSNDGTVTPVSGAVVDFAATAAVFGGLPATLPSGSATTDEHGVATFTVTDPNPMDSDTVTMSASVGTQALTGASAEWNSPVPGAVTLTPPLQTVTKGGVVGVTAQVADQFGTPVLRSDNLSYSVTGSDSAVDGHLTTSPTGSATISYTSSPTAVTPDTISVTDTNDNLTSTATVIFVTGSTTASSVVVDTTGNGTPAICPNTNGTPDNTNLQAGVSDTNVCAVVKNSTGELLAGKTVTFTVDTGQVDVGDPTATSTMTYVTTTNEAGIAMATVTATKIGTQTVTATCDGVSGSGTLTYASAGIGSARTITVSPVSSSLVPGGQQKFTFTVEDQFGNPVGGVSLLYEQSGAGAASTGDVGLLTTGSDGTASVLITTTGTDNGAGSVTATIEPPAPPTPLNQCFDLANDPVGAPAGTCVASATYTVVTSSPPTSLALSVTSGVVVGSRETVTATLKSADGAPVPGQVIRFLVTGANGVIGSAKTNATGIATFVYVTTAAGTDTITAFDDINNNQVQEGNEPGHHIKAIIGGVTDRPTIHLTSRDGTITVHVATHPPMPKVLVTYYVKRYGAFRKIGTSRAGTLGRASKEFFFPKGVVRRFKARVATKQGIVGAKTVAKKITIR